MHGRGLSEVRRCAAWAAFVLSVSLLPIRRFRRSLAQTRNLLPPELTSPVPVAPGTGSPGARRCPDAGAAAAVPPPRRPCR